MQEGLAVINGLLVYPLDDSERLKVQRRFPSCKESMSVWVQLDVYCAEGGGIGIDEVDYIKHMIKEAKKENINLNGFRLTGCQFDDTQDRRGHFKMAPDGFERKRSINPVLVDGVCFQEAKAEAGEQFHGSSAS